MNSALRFRSQTLPMLLLFMVASFLPVSAATMGLLWPTGIEPGDPAVSEAPAGKRSWWVDAAAPAGGNGSFASPFNSFETVEASVRGGDFVYVRGTFDMATNSPTHQMSLNFYRAQASGTASAPTTLKSWRGSPRAVFNSNRTDAQLRASNNGGIRFQNIEIKNFGDQGIVIGDGVLFADMVNIVAHDGQVTSGSGVGGGLVMYAEDSLHIFTVRNCLLYDTAGPNPGNNTGAFSLISEPTASLGSTVTVRDNYFHDNYVSIRHKHAGRVHMEAYNNRIEDCSIGFYLRMWTSEVHHNLFVRNKAGMKLETDGMNANHDYRVHHNTFYDTDFLVTAMPDQGGFVATLHIESNIFMDPSGGQGVIHLGAEEWNWGSNDITSWTMANNVFYFTPADRFFLYSPPPTTALRKNFVASLAQLGDTTSIYADPRFTNAAAGDFTLQSNSPAIGRGFDALAAIVSPSNAIISVTVE